MLKLYTQKEKKKAITLLYLGYSVEIFLKCTHWYTLIYMYVYMEGMEDIDDTKKKYS